MDRCKKYDQVHRLVHFQLLSRIKISFISIVLLVFRNCDAYLRQAS